MLNSVLTFLLNLLSIIAVGISTLIIAPAGALIELIFPTIPLISYVDSFYLFLSSKVLTGVAFFREVFFNLTGYPRTLFNLIIAMLIWRITYHTTIICFKFLINVYHLIRGGTTKFDAGEHRVPMLRV